MDEDEKDEKSKLFSGSGADRLMLRSNDEIHVNKTKLYLVTSLLLFVALLEKITYYGIISNLVMFCTNELEYSSTIAISVNLIFTAIAYFIPLVGGRIADTISGRFNTIYGSLLIYFVGTALLPAVAFNYEATFGHAANGFQYGLPLDSKRGFYLGGLLLIAIGFGGYKANIAPLGAQQVEPLGEDAVHSFFNWYYGIYNVGSFIACSLVVYVQQEINFFIGYAIPAAVILLAVIVFFLPRDHYLEHQKGSMVGEVSGILWQATVHKCCCRQSGNHRIVHFLDRAKVSRGGKFSDEEVNHLKYVLKTIPILLGLVVFHSALSQSTTTMLLQGERLNLKFGDSAVPVAALNSFKFATIVLCTPILDRIVFPLLHRSGKKPSLLQRYGFGMLLVAISLVCMGILEIVRKEDMAKNGGIVQKVGEFTRNASHIGIMWQIPQFVLSGFGETLTFTAGLEFIYTESPWIMQGLAMGFFQLTTTIGNIFAAVIYLLVADTTSNAGTPWLTNDVNDGHLEWFAFLLAGILSLNFLVFILLAKSYHYCRLGTKHPTIPRSRPESETLAHCTK